LAADGLVYRTSAPEKKTPQLESAFFYLARRLSDFSSGDNAAAKINFLLLIRHQEVYDALTAAKREENLQRLKSWDHLIFYNKHRNDIYASCIF
jgi:hypothetical protein